MAKKQRHQTEKEWKRKNESLHDQSRLPNEQNHMKPPQNQFR